mmetsp:Transcript_11089/g.43196  ORF Transcript_11089/g.43196 Transcript_11089/m.43196 type:complete len:200 (-) Transcript_11089:2484-3083(-)
MRDARARQRELRASIHSLRRGGVLARRVRRRGAGGFRGHGGTVGTPKWGRPARRRGVGDEARVPRAGGQGGEEFVRKTRWRYRANGAPAHRRGVRRQDDVPAPRGRVRPDVGIRPGGAHDVRRRRRRRRQAGRHLGRRRRRRDSRQGDRSRQVRQPDALERRAERGRRGSRARIHRLQRHRRRRRQGGLPRSDGSSRDV